MSAVSQTVPAFEKWSLADLYAVSPLFKSKQLPEHSLVFDDLFIVREGAPARAAGLLQRLVCMLLGTIDIIKERTGPSAYRRVSVHCFLT